MVDPRNRYFTHPASPMHPKTFFKAISGESMPLPWGCNNDMPQELPQVTDDTSQIGQVAVGAIAKITCPA